MEEKMHSKLGLKIFLLMLVTALGASLIIFITAWTGMNGLYKYSEEADAELAEITAEKAEESVLTQSEATVTGLVTERSENHDKTFQQLSSTIEALSSMLTTYYSDGSYVTSGTIPQTFADSEDGSWQARADYVAGIKTTSTLKNELKRISNIASTAGTVTASSELFRNIMIGTETGIFYRYSDYNSFADDYDPRTRDWYTLAIEHPGTAVWTGVYDDYYGDTVVTVAETYAGADGEIAGVIASDIIIGDITNEILAGDVEGLTKKSFILDGTGNVVAVSDGLQLDMQSYAESSNMGSYDAVTRALTSGETGYMTVETDNGKLYIGYAPVKTPGWTFAVLVSYDELTASVTESVAQLQEHNESSSSTMSKMVSVTTRRMINVFFICLVAVAAASAIISLAILKPVGRLVDGAHKIGAGNLDYKIEVKGNDEIAELGTAFNKMGSDLQDYVENLTEVTRDKERISTELDLATRIQTHMLPSIFPAFPHKKEFDIYASTKPAKELGGDFYDFFELDDNHIALIIADASGKGVPAALFTVITKTLIKNNVTYCGGSAGKLLEMVNKSLCENNSEEMFVTCWAAIIDITTGEMTCANAGHEFPLIRHGGGNFEVLRDKHGFVLGGMSNVSYKEYSIKLDKGDVIFCYTDGLAEALNVNKEQFGVDRALAAANQNPDGTPKELIECVHAAADEFCGEAEQFDDLTMLCYKQLV